MGNVYANGMQISSKSMSGKSICQFPDVCFTPPQTPATPPGVPIPYPNTGMASDTSDGSRSVTIGGSEVMLKDRSSFKQSTGDEAGAAPKKGLINSKTKGKVFFIAWSMDVKVEGENAVRNLDMTTHNHASPANGAAPTVHAAETALGKFDNCGGDKQKVTDNCKKDNSDQCPGMLSAKVGQQRALYKKTDEGPSRTEQAAVQATEDAEANDCVKAMRCFLRPYKPTGKKAGCCPGQTPHHIPPKSCFQNSSKRYQKGYKWKEALCVCLEGANQYVGSHGKNHSAINHLASEKLGVEDGKKCSLPEYNKACAAAVAEQCGCNPLCIEEQLNKSTEKVKPQTVTHKKIGDELPEDEKGAFSDQYDKMTAGTGE